MIKKLIVLMLLVLMIIPLGSVRAQDEGMHYCGELVEADCALLQGSTTAMKDIHSFMFTLAFDFGMDSTSAQIGNINASFSGGGKLDINFENFAKMQALAAEDMQAYLKQIPELLSKLVSGITGEASFLLTLPKEMGIPTGTDLTFDLLMKDGVIYLDAGPFMKMSGQGTGEPIWLGMDLGKFYGEAMGDMMGNMDFSSMFNSEWFSSITSPDYMKEYFQISRLADEEVMGQNNAVFETTMDYGAMMSSPAMQDYLTQIYKGMGVSQSELDSMMGAVNSMFKDAKVSFKQYIGLDDNYLHRFTMNFAFNLDGKTFDSPEMGTTKLAMSMDFGLSNFNEPVEVEIPANATVLPMSMFTGQNGA